MWGQVRPPGAVGLLSLPQGLSRIFAFLLQAQELCCRLHPPSCRSGGGGGWSYGKTLGFCLRYAGVPCWPSERPATHSHPLSFWPTRHRCSRPVLAFSSRLSLSLISLRCGVVPIFSSSHTLSENEPAESLVQESPGEPPALSRGKVRSGCLRRMLDPMLRAAVRAGLGLVRDRLCCDAESLRSFHPFFCGLGANFMSVLWALELWVLP